MLGFVDDTRKFNNQNTHGDTMEDNIIHDLQQWEKISHVIAGKLNLSKCGCYIIKWHYNKKGNYVMDTTTKYDIQMPQKTMHNQSP